MSWYKKKKFFRILAVVLAAFIVLSRMVMCKLYYYNVDNITKEELDKLELDKYNNLMIVAHPDDETIWGGAHLIEDDYLVVCLTNGRNKTRKNEFYKALAYSNDCAMIRNYPDKVYGIRDDWSNVENKIKEDIRTLLEYKKWDTVVTHNPEGEYGHQHHIYTNKYVTQVYDEVYNKDLDTKLMYFGKYYSKNDLEKLGDKVNSFTKLKDEVYNKKINEMISVYNSQGFIDDKFGQMYSYENFIEYGKESMGEFK